MEKFRKKIYPERNRRIGLLGLGANPPHCGHLEAAKLLLKKKQVDGVWLIPCGKHSFGKKMARRAHRLQMAKFLEEKGIRVSDVEIRRPGKSYTADTVEILKKEYPDHRFFWVVGSDIVKSGSYKRWKNWAKLSSLIEFLVVSRPGFKINRFKLPAGFIFIQGKGSNVSSTEIRESIRQGLPIDNLVPPKVKEYIENHNLYK